MTTRRVKLSVKAAQIDEENNVYNTEDVIANKENPRVIAKWVKDEADNYSIPEFDKVLET